MEKNIQTTIKYEEYKMLLTSNMREIFELYYYSDLSLREIGENKKISYQAVRDTIKKVEKMLDDYESKLKLVSIKSDLNILIDVLQKNNINNIEIDKITKKYR